ncbi:MAG: hypothetical protein AB1Z98_34020, partial [Nannocystaceae bacterium]
MIRGPTIAAVLGLSALASVFIASSGDADEPAPVASSGPGASPRDAGPPASPRGAVSADPRRPPTTPARPSFDPPTPPQWIAAASGAVPELNQVSLEQDLALATDVLGPGGRVLFGSGPGTATVQVIDPTRQLDPVLLALGDLFDPRGGRALRYRATSLPTAEPATAERLLGAIDHALA